MQINGLAPHTSVIFEDISRLECILPYTLVGGTALSIQIGTRLSEDLDFMSWRKSKNDKCDVQWNKIESELKTIGEVEYINLLGFDHVEFIVKGVKISFYACDKYSPVATPIKFLNNVSIADIRSIGAMKMEVMMRRATFRDYYDIYSILKTGVKIEDMIALALKYSQHRLKSKNLMSILTKSETFRRDSSFQQLAPVYDVSPKDIEIYLRTLLKSD